MSLGDWAEENCLKYLFSQTPASAPTTVYVALSTTDPGEDGASATEPSGGSYARVAVTASSGFQWDGTNKWIENVAAVTFPQATADWVSGANLQYFALFDASSGGNCLGSGALDVAKPVTNGDTAEFAAETLKVSLN